MRSVQENWHPDITEEYLFDNLTEHDAMMVKYYSDLVKRLENIYKINALKFQREHESLPTLSLLFY